MVVQALQTLRVLFSMLKAADYVCAVPTLTVEARGNANFTSVHQADELAHQGACAEVEDQTIMAVCLFSILPCQQAVLMEHSRPAAAACFQHLG